MCGEATIPEGDRAIGPKELEFFVVNSFGRNAFEGNPAAVVPDGRGVAESSFQRIARQFNLVETVFALPATDPSADWLLRYYTPCEELPVAGHPTIAALVALVESDRINPDVTPCLTVQTGMGLQKVSFEQTAAGILVLMDQPPPVYLPEIWERRNVANILGLEEDELVPDLPVQPIHTGLGHLVVPVKSLEGLLRVERNIPLLKALCQRVGVREVQAFTFETFQPGFHLHTRNICPREGIEDPGCGVGNGALGAYLLNHYRSRRVAIRLRAEQGHINQMPCTIEIRAARNEGRIELAVGGSGKVMIQGRLNLV